jgi:RNA polymerase sigma factor for flagellar operon FliA
MQDAARDQLISDHLGYANAIAASCYEQLELGGLIPMNDVLAYAREGLVQAADRYSPTAGATFPTFSYRRIHGAVVDGVRKTNMSRGAYESSRSSEGKEDPSTETDRWSGALVHHAHGVALDSLAAETELPPDVQVDARRLRSILLQAIDRLPERRRATVMRHFYDGETLADVGREFGITPRAAAKTCSRAVAQLVTILGDSITEFAGFEACP